MPITIRGSTASRVARIFSSFGSLAASGRGTFTAPASRNGRVLLALGALAPSLRGQFAVPAARDGKVSSGLGALSTGIRGSFAVPNQPPVWQTVPTITFTLGTAANRDISQYVSDPEGQPLTITKVSGTLPTGVTYNPAQKRYEYDGVGAVGGTNGHIFTADDSIVMSDWNVRKAGAMYAENFSSFADSTALQNYELISNPSRALLTTTHALSGKCAEIRTLDTDGAVSNGVIYTLNGRRMSGQSVPADVFKRFYIQVIVWADDYFDWPFQSTSNNAPKVMILDRAPRWTGATHGPTSNNGEVVIDNQSTYGFVSSYRKLTKDLPGQPGTAGQFQPWEIPRATPLNSSNIQRQNAVDSGTPLTDEASYQRRYGPFYSGMSGTGAAPGSRLSTQFGALYPDPDSAVAGAAWNRGGYTVLEIFVDYDNDRVIEWAAAYGQPARRIQDSANAGGACINTRTDISGWDGFSLSTFRTNGLAEPGVRPAVISTFYPEVIVSANPIPFPLQTGALP